MNEERMKVLNMLSEGKISSEEADRLIEAISAPPLMPASENTSGSGSIPKYLLVHVNTFKENGEEKRENVNIKIPLALLKAGVNIASLMPEDVQGEINKAMDEKGVKFNLSDIKKENLDDFLLALRELEVNVDGENERVRIFCQ